MPPTGEQHTPGPDSELLQEQLAGEVVDRQPQSPEGGVIKFGLRMFERLSGKRAGRTIHDQWQEFLGERDPRYDLKHYPDGRPSYFYTKSAEPGPQPHDPYDEDEPAESQMADSPTGTQAESPAETLEDGGGSDEEGELIFEWPSGVTADGDKQSPKDKGSDIWHYDGRKTGNDLIAYVRGRVAERDRKKTDQDN